MAIKFEKIVPGMTLLDIHGERAGNTTMRRTGLWKVEIVSVDVAHRSAVVKWNGNAPETWSAHRLTRLYAKEPPSYARAKERERLWFR